MSRIRPVEPHEAGLFTRLTYWLTKRKVRKLTGKGNIVTPIKVMAHHGRLLFAHGQMELGQAAAKSVPAKVKALALIKTATLIGCPF